MVYPNRKGADWELYEIVKDPGEKTNVAAAHPDVVKDLAQRYDGWWNDVLPQMVNEAAPLAERNAYRELFEKQFGVK